MITALHCLLGKRPSTHLIAKKFSKKSGFSLNPQLAHFIREWG